MCVRECAKSIPVALVNLTFKKLKVTKTLQLIETFDVAVGL